MSSRIFRTFFSRSGHCYVVIYQLIDLSKDIGKTFFFSVFMCMYKYFVLLYVVCIYVCSMRLSPNSPRGFQAFPWTKSGHEKATMWNPIGRLPELYQELRVCHFLADHWRNHDKMIKDQHPNLLALFNSFHTWEIMRSWSILDTPHKNKTLSWWT